MITIQWNKNTQKVVYWPAFSVLNNHLTVPVEDASFKDSADRKLEKLLKAPFTLAGQALQPAIAGSICLVVTQCL